jgi:hypothetical protein
MSSYKGLNFYFTIMNAYSMNMIAIKHTLGIPHLKFFGKNIMGIHLLSSHHSDITCMSRFHHISNSQLKVALSSIRKYISSVPLVGSISKFGHIYANEKLQHQKTNRKGILWTCLSRNQHGNPRRGGNQSHPCLRERAMRGYPSNCIFEFQLTF